MSASSCSVMAGRSPEWPLRLLGSLHCLRLGWACLARRGASLTHAARVSKRVSVNGTVRLDIEQEISEVPQTSASTPNLTPTISERRVKSQISVANGQTVLLAHLIKEQQ